MKIINKLIEWQVFVAICITGLTLFFQVLLKAYNPYLLFITGIGTFVLYNFSVKDIQVIQTKLKWLLMILFVTTVLVAFFHLKPISLFLLGCLFLLTLLYKIPLFGIKFRDIPFLKLFQIGFVWSSLVVLLPILELNNQNLSFSLWLSNFLFVIAITLPFDFNDIQEDKHTLRTIPMQIGILPTKALCTLLLLVSAFLFHLENPNVSYRISWFITIAIAIGLCLNISDKKSRFYYRFWIESLSLIPIIIYSIILFLG